MSRIKTAITNRLLRKELGHSRKDCVCGGHSEHDHKKNKKFHSTMVRLMIRKRREK